MSAAREVLRLATIRALRGRTWAQHRVRDSEQGPVEDRAEPVDPNDPHARLPVIAVYTDDGAFGVPGAGGNRDILGGGWVNLVIEIVVTQRMSFVDPQTGQLVRDPETGDVVVGWDAPETDAAMELTIGMIERQVRLALADPGSAWAELWRMLAVSVNEVSTQRGASMRDGVRFAGRQIIMPVTLPRDPVPGTTLGRLWETALALIDAEPDLEPVRAVLRALVEGSWLTAPDDLACLRGGFAMTRDEAAAMLHEDVGPAGAEFDENGLTIDGAAEGPPAGSLQPFAAPPVEVAP